MERTTESCRKKCKISSCQKNIIGNAHLTFEECTLYPEQSHI